MGGTLSLGPAVQLDLERFQTLIGLVAHYSPTGQEEQVVAWLVARMAGLGFRHSFVDQAGNAVGIMGEGRKQLVLLGHIDTVSGEIPLQLSQGPDGYRLYGRGTVDAKGALAAFIDAVAAMGPSPGWQVVVIGAVDEEGESRGARYVCGQYRPDYAIIGEPSQWDRVTLGYKGSASAEIAVERPKTHSASDVDSAPEAAFSLWSRICEMASEFNHERVRLFDQLTPGLQGFSSWDDGFVSSATLQIGTRLPQDLPPAAWYSRLQELLVPFGATVIPKGYAIPAYRAESDSPLVRAFLGGIRSEGGNPRYVVKTGTADLNIVAPVWECPALAYGPGDSSFDHTSDENLLLEDYLRSVAVLKLVIKRILV